MSFAKYDNRSVIRDKLKKLDCTENAFAEINAVMGRTKFFAAMRGEPGKHFSESEGKRLFEIITEMEQLQHQLDVGINWSNVDRVILALVARRIQIAGESEDRKIDSIVESTTNNLK